MVRLTTAALAFGLALASPVSAQQLPRIEVRVEEPTGPGRLLLFAERIPNPDAAAPPSVSADFFFKKDNFVAAREVEGLQPGAVIGLDGDDVAYPTSMNALPPGDYWVQAVLDRDHDYAYRLRPGGGDIVTPVAKVRLPLTGATPLLALSTTVAEYPLWETARGPMFSAEDRAIVEARIKPFEFVSPALSAFQGRPVAMRGLVVTPEGYDAGTDTYPVVYLTHGFTAGMASLSDSAVGVLTATHAGRLPPMIWVMLDQSSPFGTHEFADSVNNGPWATALTRELIPDLERRYRVDATPASRFLMGHSSGGWAMLWLQLNYPDQFGGAWISSPDFTDFTDFEGIDITRPDARIICDANEGWNIDKLDNYAGKLAKLGVEMVEQPCHADDDEGLRHLKLPILICADESCHVASDVEGLVGKYDLINIKLDKAGGISGAMELSWAAEMHDMGVMLGCMLGTSLAMAPGVLAAQGARYVDLDGPLALTRDREPSLIFRDGQVFPPDRELWG